MFLRRAAPALARRAVMWPTPITRTFALSTRRNSSRDPTPGEASSRMVPFEEVKSEHDLLPPTGAKPGTMPTDIEQATGLERLEILGKMQGVDIFDMRPLDASRKGTMSDPIVVKSYGDEQYVGCTGYPADTHVVTWLTTSRDRPIERCPECGGVYKLEYVGPTDDGHGHGHGHGHDDAHGHHAATDGVHNYEGEPKTMADFVKPEYR